MSLPLSNNMIFDIEEEDMDISDGSDNEFDNMLDHILDATDSVNQLQDGLVTKENIYAIMYDTMKACIYLDNDEIKSLDKWKAKIIGISRCCLFECDNQEQNLNSVDIGFIFIFQTKKQIELIQYSRVLCLDDIHRMNQYSCHLFTLFICHPTAGSGFLIAFLITAVWRDLWYLMKTEGWDDAKANKQITEVLNRWQNFEVKAVNNFADYFKYWWRPKYDKWMVCLRGISKDIIDMNNLIEAFYSKLKYVYMREKSEQQLDSEVYLLAEIVL
ncbi:hypothetical protein F8M41_019022 [Gigaspora margarita]|uniref:MULE transposase domain-containing protein n=1 Tax=Gigaspora margarita TaxID=4874 RepID=A0A8H4AKL6_GIGMA|nr:hypothetical protein F8M41_019022 [Gigaspora margarita]